MMPPGKRSSSVALASGASQASKRVRQDSTRFHPNTKRAEEFGIVNRAFYPPEMRNERCDAYNNGDLERPIESLQKACEEARESTESVKANAAVVHWFKSDLRLHDNRSLQTAYQVACDNGIPLIALYIFSPEDLTAHICSAPRVDLTIRTLALLRRDLDELDIPFYMETQQRRSDIPSRIVDLCRQWGANHLFANLEYEVDELRREAQLVGLCSRNGVKFNTVHDTCVVPPGLLTSQQGKQYAVYSPWYRSWVAFLKKNPDYLELVDKPGVNPGNPRQYFEELFGCDVPAAPKNKQLSDEEKKHFRTLYPEGEHEALRRLEEFLREKAGDYENARNKLAGAHTSILSPYFASGALSARAAVVKASQKNNNQLDRNEPGFVSWISEVAWRDFYKHVLVHWPFIW
jgi:deoxyribodipyrimidine photo-lyase